MAQVARRPLAPRAQFTVPPVFSKPPTVAPLVGSSSTITLKRSRSPDAQASRLVPEGSTKRHRPAAQTKDPEEKEKEKRRLRAELDEEFRRKYSRAFPQWTFYFDVKDDEKERLSLRVLQLGGRRVEFFSNEVTHFITNKPVPEADEDADKENAERAKASGAGMTLRSPIKLRGLPGEDVPISFDPLVRKARRLGMKIWDTTKLDSVLSRCLVPQSHSTTRQNNTRSLTSLLESEKRHGMTSERDPNQKRHDFHYFSKNSYFVLVEDIEQQLATIAAMEYPIPRSNDGKDKPSWPVLHCHPLSRGPFVEYNDKEERYREKQERLEREREEERTTVVQRIKMQKQELFPRKFPDLRRSVSMNNMHRAATEGKMGTLDLYDSKRGNVASNVDASGFDSTATGAMASGYTAASGNSVGITSTFGTTSAVGSCSTRVGAGLPALRGFAQNQVVWSRRATGLDKESGEDKENDNKDLGQSKEKASASSAIMPPPMDIPTRRVGQLRKARSTNTMRLPKRDERSKPGYCESCRVKFEDFDMHIMGRKHRKFAQNDAHFLELDCVLNRVRRVRRAEVQEQKDYEDQILEPCPYQDAGVVPQVDPSEEEEDEILLSPRKSTGSSPRARGGEELMQL